LVGIQWQEVLLINLLNFKILRLSWSVCCIDHAVNSLCTMLQNHQSILFSCKNYELKVILLNFKFWFGSQTHQFSNHCGSQPILVTSYHIIYYSYMYLCLLCNLPHNIPVRMFDLHHNLSHLLYSSIQYRVYTDIHLFYRLIYMCLEIILE
jgi:hypothetical protein